MNLTTFQCGKNMQDGQKENLDRVTAKIGALILVFYKDHGTGYQFHSEELRDFIIAKVGIIAPGSPDRIMRNLRQKHWLDYRVLSRRDSLYEITWP
jgi:hypothetical protein